MNQPVTCVRAFEVQEDAVVVLDQRALPAQQRSWRVSTPKDMALAIQTLAVRGAPLIGAAAAYGVWLGAHQALAAGLTGETFERELEAADAVLRASRPTAVNLFVGLDRVRTAWRQAGPDAVARHHAIKTAADALAQEDRQACLDLAAYGAPLLPDGGGVMTHCNTGALATCGVGTAAGVIRGGLALGKRFTVHANETRPLLQGARLTAWELRQDGIDVTLQVDGAAAWLMAQGTIHAVVVGADRIAANGDTANKVGTYGLALAAAAHGIPFYVAAPVTTLDLHTPDGNHIVVEQRAASEVTHLGGQPVAAPGVAVANPAFDVTPARLITALITNRGVARPVDVASVAALLA